MVPPQFLICSTAPEHVLQPHPLRSRFPRQRQQVQLLFPAHRNALHRVREKSYSNCFSDFAVQIGEQIRDNSPPDFLNQKGLLGSFRTPMQSYPRRRCPRPSERGKAKGESILWILTFHFPRSTLSFPPPNYFILAFVRIFKDR